MKPTLQILIAQRYVVAAPIPRRKSPTMQRLAVRDIDVPVTIGRDTDWANLVEAIVGAAKQLDCPHHAISLIIPSSWCYLCCLDRPAKRFDPVAMSFEMEESLPVPLETVTNAFAVHEQCAIGVAVVTDALQGMLTALEDRGVGVVRIWADVLVASAMAKARGGSAASVIDIGRSASIKLPQDGETCAVVRNRISGDEVNGQDVAVPVEGSPSGGHAMAIDLRTPPSPNDEPLADSDEDCPGAMGLVGANLSFDNAADLRIGPLARQDRHVDLYRQVSRVAVLCIAFCLIALGSGYRQKLVLNRQIETLQKEQSTIYGKVFPDGLLPPNPATRLASERKRIEALASTDSTGPMQVAANQPMNDLRQFVAALPKDVRILVDEILIDAKQFSLRGQTVSHRDAERISDAIGTIEGMEVGPPRTSRLKNGGVEFGLKGRRENAIP